ncbi:MAG: hydratase [Candidatus Schekmanbacteria bacterium]|nr:MAG: hydratase [Candidatus Schekmanbacteria bacterium]
MAKKTTKKAQKVKIAPCCPIPPYPGEREKGKESLVKVAAIQMEPEIANREKNVNESLRLIKEAVKKGVKLAILPELCNTGYIYNSRQEAFACAEPVPDGPTSKAWMKAAKDGDIYICAGITEREENRLYNTVAVFGPEGFLGRYRKTHLWNEEKMWFTPGDVGYPVFELPFGKIGCRICYDGWFPEITRIYMAQGVDIVCDSTNWVIVPGIQTPEKPAAAYTAQALSLMSSMYTICADRIGVERGCTYLGNSCIIDPAGNFVAGPASFDKPEVVVAEINVMAARYKHWSEFNNPLTDRRTDLYDNLLGYRPPEKK